MPDPTPTSPALETFLRRVRDGGPWFSRDLDGAMTLLGIDCTANELLAEMFPDSHA